MGLGREEEVEIRSRPLFLPGEKVEATRHVKNDGTYPGKDIGENLVRKGDTGYVRDIGTFLQQFYIYSVEWVERGTLVGMRARELKSLDHPQKSVRAARGLNSLQRGGERV
ncbi:nitrogen fixation protein NifZ [Martelella alba]|uniref:Nitrogen fixation protein NifZ n=1 Tax=Martelella alba TaxID=2590451 RepID=A0A506UDP5_9HYPH|nr:nitrogen fixation protein NifZ [Martelella alba]TPW32553.1 nitrogen fixation protein NifZ [Martelella alba]